MTKKFIGTFSQYIQAVVIVNIVLKITLRLCYNSADLIYQDSSGILYGVSAGISLNSGHSLVGKPTRELSWFSYFCFSMRRKKSIA